MGGGGYGSGGGKYRGGRQRMGVQRGKAPRDHKKQNKQIDDIEKFLGKKLTPKQRRQIHDDICKMGYGFQEILEIAKGILGEKGDKK